MTRWLERQEAVDRYTAYLHWHATKDQAVANNMSAPPPEEEESLVTYAIAKQPPPASRHVLASSIISPDAHSASRFLPALSTFLQTRGSTFIPREFDVFGLWKQLVFKLPDIPEVGSRHTLNVVRASAPVTEPTSGAGRRRAQVPAHLDYALVKTAEVNPLTVGTPLQGLRVAHVKAIFQLPSHYPVKEKQPLAYVEWFTSFRTVDSTTGYFHVTRSTRRKRGIDGPYAEIITVDRIVRNAMLQQKNDRQYFVNSHIDGHTFSMFKLGRFDCLPRARVG
ncbi:hypothetical protein GALMADRAFT_145973 [Galerina marginata CBS 339.88]|uniref:Uncharacterized protein n=1 Tax=Galerina marginata (strain CBS 339.88) TaxID=685588 RepID=A0A067SDL4_GALM3|nr:hypothetical protein GALMADRAFT_145973 [Galerina marginata CBS 339.88]